MVRTRCVKILAVIGAVALCAAPSAPPFSPFEFCKKAVSRALKSAKRVLANQSVLAGIPLTTETPLSDALVEAIQRHPVSKLMKKYPDKNWTFVLENYTSEEKGIDPNSVQFGENIQAGFVAKILRAANPKARIVSGTGDFFLDKYTGPEKNAFPILVQDGTEAKESKYFNVVDMKIAKAANPTPPPLEHLAARERFGIGAEKKVASFYLDSLDQSAVIDGETAADIPDSYRFKNVFRRVEASTGDLDVVFVTMPYARGNKMDLLIDSVTRPLGRPTRIFTLSDVSQSQIQQALAKGEKVFIINDTRGRMPLIHAVADVTIVRGPINPFESLNAGTPTVAFFDQPMKPRYDLAAYQSMVQPAYQTGSFRYVQKLDDLSVALSSVREKRNTTPVPLIQDGKGTPFSRLLDRLTEIIEFEIAHPEAAYPAKKPSSGH